MIHRILIFILAAWVPVVVSAAPRITSLSPNRQVLQPGQTLELGVTATGVGSLYYQWKCNGRALHGETGGSLLITKVTPQDSGYYQVVVADATGSLVSATMFVLVAPATTQVVVWGDAFSNLTSVPAGLTDAVAIAVGSSHVLVLKANGTIIGWGRDSWGMTAIPAGLSNVVAIATNDFKSIALKADGTVVSWGRESGVPAGLTNVVAITDGYHSSLALKADNTAMGWGGVDGSPFFSLSYAGIEHLKDLVALAPGSMHTIVLNVYGTVIGLPQDDYPGARVPQGLDQVDAIAAGLGYSLAVRNDGTVVAWGDNDNGELNVPAGLTDVMAITSGGSHSVALKDDGTVVAWGFNRYGQCTVPAGLDKVFAIGANYYNSAVIRDATNGNAPIIVPPASPAPTPTPTPASSSGGGGGGAINGWSLVALGLITLLRWIRRAPV